MQQKTVHVISHSHWDREWYMPYENHHVRLIALMDTLMELLERDPEYRSFHLDGQTIMLEDYLQVRPEMDAKVKAYIQEGRLINGPWYILQDEFLTSSEANIRNLLIGHYDAKKYGPVCKIGYFPDSFGNMGQAPQILRQAGMDTAVFGRGVKPVGFNNEASGDYESSFSEMHWQSPDGSSVLGILFANWYHNGMEIPVETGEAESYWRQRIPNVEQYAATPHLLFMNGCDHQPVQTDLSEALQQARKLFPDIAFEHSNFPAYVERVRASIPDNLSTVHGELRSQRTDGWFTLVNTASARVYIKQANQRGQAILEKVAEPLAAMAAMAASQSYPHHLFRYAWKTLMQNHPHDSICGCSVDEVHREMMTRFAKSYRVAEELIEESVSALGSAIDTASAFQAIDDNALPFTVWNTTGWSRTGIVSIDLPVMRIPLVWGQKQPPEELNRLSIDGYAVVDAKGKPVPAKLEDLGVAFGYSLPKDKFREPYMARSVRVTIQAKDVPSLGYTTFALVKQGTAADAGGIVAEQEERTMENEFLQLTIADDGTFTMKDKRNGRTYAGLGAYENTGDIGNEYIFRQPSQDIAITTAGMAASISLIERNAFTTEYEIVHEWMIPESADETFERERDGFIPFLDRQAQRSKRMVPLVVTTRISLEHGVPKVQMKTRVNNQAKDHRLRILLPSDIVSPVHRADSIFEVALRTTIPAKEWVNPSNCQHQQAFVNVSDDGGGLTIANLGMNEYEVLQDGRGTIAVTLLRCVGELGDWGVFPTPEAQCLGDHEFEYAIIPHTGGDGLSASYAAAYQEQVPWTVRQLPLQQGSLGAEHQFLRWSGEGMALSAVKMSEESGDLVLRWFNTAGKPSTLTVSDAGGIHGWYKSNVLEEGGEAVIAGSAIPVRTAEIITLCGKNEQL